MIIDIKESNKKIIELIKKNEPFTVCRLGNGYETYITYEYIKTNKINENYLHPNVNLNGIYSKTNEIEKFKKYCELYNEAIINTDFLACFVLDNNYITNIQNDYSIKYNLSVGHSRVIEPFYLLMENEIPWSHYLVNKKVLIVNPFVESFKEQIKNGFEIFKDNRTIFLPNQEFIFYESYQTIAGNHIHNDWYETFNIMCNDIEKLDFDIALLGCGGYGLPLCNFIKNKMKKSAIYIGGGLQLLFGVMGTRWENNEMWKKIIEENDCKFIRPSKDEICNNFKNIENGCYW